MGEAVTLNEQILERFQKDAEAYNRLGRAKLALGKLEEAKDAYSKALRADPANLIARRNLQRLESLRGHSGRAPADFCARAHFRERVFFSKKSAGRG